MLHVVLPGVTGPMGLIVSTTHPAELVAAFAGHMVAALVLLYIDPALRAWFRVGHYPGQILTFVVVFHVPAFNIYARCRPMGLSRAAKAKSEPANAGHIDDAATAVFHGICNTKNH